MKEATGEVSMTAITVAAIAIIGGILAIFWTPIKITIAETFGGSTKSACENIDMKGISCSWSDENGCGCYKSG